MDAEFASYLGAAVLDTLQDIARQTPTTDRTEENLAILAREVEFQNHWLERISLSLEAIVAFLERQEPQVEVVWPEPV